MKMHSIGSRFVIGPSNILSAGVFVYTFQLGNCTGSGSEGVNDWLEGKTFTSTQEYICIHVHNAGVGEKQLTFLHMHAAKKHNNKNNKNMLPWCSLHGWLGLRNKLFIYPLASLSENFALWSPAAFHHFVTKLRSSVISATVCFVFGCAYFVGDITVLWQNNMC